MITQNDIELAERMEDVATVGKVLSPLLLEAAARIRALVDERDEALRLRLLDIEEIGRVVSVADRQRISAEALVAKQAQVIAEMREAVSGAIGILMNCSVEAGVCCCGDSMENHAEPMNCGHSPVDQGTYSANQWLEKAIALTRKEPL